jgi:hypothetical protein
LVGQISRISRENTNQFHGFDVLGDAVNITTSSSIVLLLTCVFVEIWKEMCNSIHLKANAIALLDFGRNIYASLLIFSTILPGCV